MHTETNIFTYTHTHICMRVLSGKTRLGDHDADSLYVCVIINNKISSLYKPLITTINRSYTSS